MERSRACVKGCLCAISCCLLCIAHEVTGRSSIVSTGRPRERAPSQARREEAAESYGRQTPPVLLTLSDASCGNALIDLGYVHFNEVVRVPWIIRNHTKQPLRLLGVVTDCACSAARPENDVAGPAETLTGHVDYRQGNLGTSRRSVLFRTSGQDLLLNIVSTKACDHYLHPTPLTLKDGASVEVAFHALYLQSARTHEFRISKVSFDPNYLALSDTRPVVSAHRSVAGGKIILEYEEDIVRMSFRAARNCPIGRCENDIQITVRDLRGLLPDYVYRVPVFLSVYKGIAVTPSAVTVGVVDASTMKMPLVREVTIRGLKGRTIGTIKTIPQVHCVVPQLLTASEDAAVIRVAIDHPPVLLRTHLVIDLPANGADRDSGEAIFIPILGVFK
jgi:hypothetical protein